MKEFKNEMAIYINKAVRDLFSDKDKYHRLDVDVIADTISEFVMSREDFTTINDANRYEAFHQILGKAVAVTQGWKQNCADQIEVPSETRENLNEYMQKTYGKVLH